MSDARSVARERMAPDRGAPNAPRASALPWSRPSVGAEALIRFLAVPFLRPGGLVLTFEIVDESEIEIHGDAEGLRALADRIVRLLDEKLDHDHLMTPSWGGSGLSEEAQNRDAELVNMVTIHVW